MGTCDCLAHIFAREWSHVQKGEAYIVHATGVTSARGAGGYLAKYMKKEFDKERGEELGMARRWSTSHSWPRESRPRLKTTLKGGWRRSYWAPGQLSGIEEWPGLDVELLERLETEAQAKERRRRSAGALLKIIGGIVGNEDVSEANLSAHRIGGG